MACQRKLEEIFEVFGKYISNIQVTMGQTDYCMWVLKLNISFLLSILNNQQNTDLIKKNLPLFLSHQNPEIITFWHCLKYFSDSSGHLGG